MTTVVTQHCPACRRPPWRGRRRFGPSRVTCAHCGAEIETGLRDWNSMSPGGKQWHVFLEWFLPAYLRGFGFPERQILYFTHWFLVAIPIMPVMLTIIAFSNGDWGALIGVAIFLCFTLAHLLWLLRRVQECRPAGQAAAPRDPAKIVKAVTPREEKKWLEDYEYATGWLKKVASPSGVMGTMKAGSMVAKLVGDPRYWPALVGALKDEDAGTRRSAALYVGGIGDRELVLQPLIDALRDPDPTTRANAACSLGEIADPRARPHLQALTQDPEALVRQRAEEALQHLKPAAGADRKA